MMNDRTFKFVYFTPNDKDVRCIKFGLFKISMILGLLLFASAFLVATISKAFFSYKEDSTIASLKKENAFLEKLLGDFSKKAQGIEMQLDHMRKKEDVIRAFANIGEIDADTWDIGTGGSDRTPYWDKSILLGAKADSVVEMYAILEKLEHQANILFESQNQIEARLSEDQNLRLHTPSIFPVARGEITSKFGKRVDPFIETIRHHNGIDIVAQHGAPVLAPSEGTVEYTRNKYNASESFGRLIVIDHGYGIKTRFGHLSKIYVKEGEKVKRYDKIGAVGSTGRSTGTHLHYEIIINGKFLNPQDYILNF